MTTLFTASYGKTLIFICFCLVPAVVSQLPANPFSVEASDQHNSAFQEYLVRTQPYLGAFFGVRVPPKVPSDQPGYIPELEVIFPKQTGLAWMQ